MRPTQATSQTPLSLSAKLVLFPACVYCAHRKVLKYRGFHETHPCRSHVVACSALSHAQATPAPSQSTESIAKSKIEQIERDRNQAILAGDAAALDRMTSEDYTFITLRGDLRTKAEILQGFRSSPFTTIRAESLNSTYTSTETLPLSPAAPSRSARKMVRGTAATIASLACMCGAMDTGSPSLSRPPHSALVPAGATVN